MDDDAPPPLSAEELDKRIRDTMALMENIGLMFEGYNVSTAVSALGNSLVMLAVAQFGPEAPEFLIATGHSLANSAQVNIDRGSTNTMFELEGGNLHNKKGMH